MTETRIAATRETPPLTRGRPESETGNVGGAEKHPRLRGEDANGQRRSGEYRETPPLTRGRLDRRADLRKVCGNTPAYAGKTVLVDICLQTRRKHPRLRGEDETARTESFEELRNTPAYAGKTVSCSLYSTTVQKHPRLRGEDPSGTTSAFRPMETPPLTRGRRHPSINKELRLGNTPAYAGKTGRDGGVSGQVGKHPRLRGEDLPKPKSAARGPETPPLTRGRRYTIRFCVAWCRNTPAYAGKTDLIVITRRLARKHPRLRGEDSESQSISF